jgi:hypothetical protein
MRISCETQKILDADKDEPYKQIIELISIYTLSWNHRCCTAPHLQRRKNMNASAILEPAVEQNEVYP